MFEGSLKQRCFNKTAFFRYINKQATTTLADYIWKMKALNMNLKFKWYTLERSGPYTN